MFNLGPGFEIFQIMMIGSLILAGVMFVLSLFMMFSPKVRSKFMGIGIKSGRMALEDNKEELEKMGKTGFDIQRGVMEGSIDTLAKIRKASIDVEEQVLEENADRIGNINTTHAKLNAKGVETTARALKKGFTQEEEKQGIYCKHCGDLIDVDSKFCKSCGGKL